MAKIPIGTTTTKFPKANPRAKQPYRRKTRGEEVDPSPSDCSLSCRGGRRGASTATGRPTPLLTPRAPGGGAPTARALWGKEQDIRLFSDLCLQLSVLLIIIIIIIMKNFNRRSSHGHHGSKRRVLNYNIFYTLDYPFREMRVSFLFFYFFIFLY